jgi:hypothetical protein
VGGSRGDQPVVFAQPFFKEILIFNAPRKDECANEGGRSRMSKLAVAIAALLTLTPAAAETVSVVTCPPKLGYCIREYKEVKSSCRIEYERGLPESRACREAAEQEINKVRQQLDDLKRQQEQSLDRSFRQLDYEMQRGRAACAVYKLC